MKTIKSYKKDVLRKYQEGKSQYLKALSPAKIRQACLLKFENGLDKEDLNTFARFFDFNEKDTYLESIKKIESVDIDKFRPFKNFLNNKTKDTLNKNAELIAVLVDFKPRPYKNYRKQESGNMDLTENSFKEIKATDIFFSNNSSSCLPKQNSGDLSDDNLYKKSLNQVGNVEAKSRVDFRKLAFVSVSFFGMLFFMERYLVLKDDLKKATIINNFLEVDSTYKEDVLNYLNSLSVNAQVIPLLATDDNDSKNINSKEVSIRYFQHQGVLYFGIVNR